LLRWEVDFRSVGTAAAQPCPRKKQRVSGFPRTSFLILWVMAKNRNLSAAACYQNERTGPWLFARKLLIGRFRVRVRRFQESFSGADMGTDGASPAPAAAAAPFAFPFVGSVVASDFLSLSPTR